MAVNEPTDIRPAARNDNVSWKIVAYAATAVIWAVSFAMLGWLVNGVSTLKQDMAVVKHVLRIDRNNSKGEGQDSTNKQIMRYEEPFH